MFILKYFNFLIKSSYAGYKGNEIIFPVKGVILKQFLVIRFMLKVFHTLKSTKQNKIFKISDFSLDDDREKKLLITFIYTQDNEDL